MELGSSIAGMDKQIFTLIDATLQDVTFLRQFLSTNLTRVKFDRSIGGNLVVEIPIESSKSKEGQGDSAGGSSRYDVRTTVIVSLISSFLAAMFMYAVYFHRKTDSTDASKSIQERAARVQSKRRQYFQNLDDDPSLSSGWMVTDTMPDAPTNQQTTAWSDLTSDSESIISVLPMDRIDEEGTNEDSENDGEEIEVCLNENESSMVGVGSLSSAGLVSPIHIDHLSFIAHWNIHSEESEEKSLPEEAQTNKGGPKIESIEIEVDSDPFCFEEGDTPVRKNRLSSIEDAATGTATTATYTQESASTAGLRGCEFIFDHNNHASLFHPTGTGTHSLDSSLLDFSSDDDNHEYGGYHSNTDEETENRRQVFVPKAILLRDEAAVGQLRTDALFSEASDTTLVRSSGHNVLPPDTKLADWARLAIGKLTTGGVGLITCTNAHPQMPTNNL